MGIRIAVGAEQQQVVKQLSSFLVENGYEVVIDTCDGYDFLRKVHMVYPDICIIDYRMKGMNGHEVAEMLVFDRLAPVIVTMLTSDIHHFSNLVHESFFSNIVKPINRNILLNQIEILSKTSKDIIKLERQINDLKKKMKEQDAISKAKLILISENGLSENDAHKKILKDSMDYGISKYKVAKNIINKNFN